MTTLEITGLVVLALTILFAGFWIYGMNKLSKILDEEDDNHGWP